MHHSNPPTISPLAITWSHASVTCDNPLRGRVAFSSTFDVSRRETVGRTPSRATSRLGSGGPWMFTILDGGGGRKNVSRTWQNKRSTENARGERASLRLCTDVSLLASLYPKRAKPAGAPFSFSLSVYLSLPLSLSSTCSALSPLLSLLFLVLSYIYILHVSLLLQCTPFFSSSNHLPQCSPSSCAFLPYLAPTFLLPPLQLFTSSTTNVFFYLVTFESSFSLPPIPLHNLLSFFRSKLRSFPIFGSCRSLTPFLSSSFYPSFSIQLGLCIPVSARLSKASSSAVFRPNEFGPLLSQSLYLSLSHFSPFFSYLLCTRSIWDPKTTLYCHGDHMVPALKSLVLSSSPLSPPPPPLRVNSRALNKSVHKHTCTHACTHSHAYLAIAHTQTHSSWSFCRVIYISTLSWSDDRFRLSHDYQSDLAS